MAKVVGFSHLAFNVADFEASLDFYCNKLGLEKTFELFVSDKIKEVLPDHPAVNLIGKSSIAYIDCGNGSFIEIFRPIPGVEMKAGGPNYTDQGFLHVSLQVDCLEDFIRELQEKGVEIDSPISQSPDHTYQAWIHDPDGNRIELMEYTKDSLQTLKPMNLGLNVMSLITPMREDYEGSVDRLNEGADFYELMSDWGGDPETIVFYQQFTGGPSGWDPENAKKRMAYLNAKGTPAKGLFIFEDRIMEQAEALGQYCQEMNLEYVVLSFLDYEKGIDSVYEKIDLMKALAAILKKYNVQVVVHNHEHDFAVMTDRDGKEKQVMTIFMEQLDASEMMLELDTGWLLYAGIDPAAYIKEHLDRVKILHLKDIKAGFETMPRENIFISCGEGCVDFAGILAVIPPSMREQIYFVLDQDASEGDIMEDQIKSLQYFKKIAKEFWV